VVSSGYGPEQQYLFEVIKTRRTVRKFRAVPVPEEHVLSILDAARFAPTAGNQQPWTFLVVRDRGKLDELKEETLNWYLEDQRRDPAVDRDRIDAVSETVGNMLEDVLSAPVYVAVLVDTRAMYPEYVIYDGALAAGYLMIAARALGYGTGFFTTFFPDEEMKKFFGIPEYYRLICFTPIGVPDAWPETPPKKDLDDLVVFESFGG
jgi:nitroreductase